jgi:hypothetical protein
MALSLALFDRRTLAMPEHNDNDANEAPSSLTSEEQRAAAHLADEIYRELQEKPPLTCSITYTGPAEEAKVREAVHVIQLHTLLMRRKHPWLSFESLDSIVFHADYALALREISERAGRTCEATAEDTGVGLAMVVHLDEKCVAVMSAGLLTGMLAADNIDTQNLCIDTVCHELCHVHDYGRKRRLLAHEFLTRRISPRDRHTFPAADSAWSEYFANKYSHSVYSSPDMHPRYLAEVVPSVVSDIQAAIRSYRTHGDLNALLPLCQQKVRFLLQCLGYAAGRLSATGSGIEDIAPESVNALRRAQFWDVWLAVRAELDRLDDCRDAWTSFDELRTLMTSVDAVYRRLGLFYSVDASGAVRVDIPYTPETMPP